MTKVKGNEFRVINYTDVWGNEEDGFEVNNQCVEDDALFISEDATDAEILQMMIELGYIKHSAILGVNVNLCNMGDMIEIEESNGYPMYRLDIVYQ